MLQWVKNLLKKKKEPEYPYEFAEVIFNDLAKSQGLDDYPNKLIKRYRYNEKIRRLELYRTYGYSDSLVHAFRKKLKIPVYDSTTEEEQFPTHLEINLDEIRYVK